MLTYSILITNKTCVKRKRTNIKNGADVNFFFIAVSQFDVSTFTFILYRRVSGTYNTPIPVN